MSDLLTDTLPTEWEGRAIDPDFRPMVWLLTRTPRTKTDEDNARLICEAVQRFFVKPMPVTEYQEAFESRIRFCQGGVPEDEERTGTGDRDPQDEPVLDYRCDADYLVGAFQQAYGIDLTADKVHWWRFKALLHALPEGTRMSEILGYRGMDTSEIKDKERREYCETMKERFALPNGLKGVKRHETLQEHEDAFLDRFG